MSVKNIYSAVLEYNENDVKAGVTAELAEGTSADEILNDGLISAMDEVGRLFSDGDIFVPEMLMAAKVMKAGLEILAPQLKSADSNPSGIVVIGTVKGDLHDIGKNLVAIMLEGGGFTVIDLGVDVPSEKFVDAAKENNADVIAVSALLTTTMPAMKSTVSALKEAGLHKTIVGGAPVTQEFADEIGAAGYSADAPGAVRLARTFIQ